MATFYLEKSLGVDIREDSISLTLLGKNLSRVDVIASKFIPMQSIDLENEKYSPFFIERVNHFMIENNAWVENIVVSLPRSKVTLQSFELPAPDINSVNSMMKFELERHFSSDVENFYHSNHISPRGNNQYHILCAAIKKDAADHYLELLKKLNVKTTILDVSTFANLNLLWPIEKNNDLLAVTVDLSLSFIDISIIKNGALEFSKNIHIKDLNYREAFINAETQQKSIANCSKGVTQTIVEEIQNALASCRSINDSTTVEAIYILGGGNLLSYLLSPLEKTAETTINRLHLPDFIKAPVPDNFSMAFMGTSLGLALRGLKQNLIEANLLPENLKTAQRKKINIKTTISLIAATILFVIGFITNQNIYENKILASLDKQLKELKTEMGPLEKVDFEYKSLQNYIEILDRIDQIHPTKLPILIELSQIIPKDTWLKKIQIKKNRMEIMGISRSASRIVPIVENSNYFQDTHFVGTIISSAKGEKFSISSTIGKTQ